MNDLFCPYCQKKELDEREYIRINMRELEEAPMVLDFGVLPADKYFCLQQYRCIHCGEEFWIQEGDK